MAAVAGSIADAVAADMAAADTADTVLVDNTAVAAVGAAGDG